jgi:GntR family transcriptional regulator/MocR family aminotransferase
MVLDETSRSIELLLAVTRNGPGTLGAQIEGQLRQAIRAGTLRSGTAIPSTRDLARQIGVSRRVVVDAYAQLAAEGYLRLRQGARPCVSPTAPPESRRETKALALVRDARFDFRPSVPDVSAFPRAAWLRSMRVALATMTDADLGYGDPRGVEVLRAAVGEYLGRVRGVVADPEHIVITSGYTQGLGLVCRALAVGGAKRIGLEDPSNPEDGMIARRAGLEPVAIGVDDAGTRISDLVGVNADAVIVTPAHQNPSGVVLTGERRTDLLAWLGHREAIAVEDDYDAEYRYDRAAVGALQGLDPDRVAYLGSTSKTLAPALRIGWLVVPPRLLDAVVQEKLLADRGTARIEQHALADFLHRGELDRHLRRMRARYRVRRDALTAALSKAFPEATVRGIAAGLHVTLQMPDGDDEQAIRDQAVRRGIRLETLGEYRGDSTGHPPTLLLGYAQMSEPALRAAVRTLADAVRAAKSEASSTVS